MNQSAHDYMPKSSATLQLFSKYIVYCFQWILHRLRELSYLSNYVLFQRDLTCLLAFSNEYSTHERVLQSMLFESNVPFSHTFRNRIMQRVMLRYYMCLRVQHTSKECCVHSKTFFQGKTCSKYYYIYPFERNSTIFLNMLQHLMQYVRYSFKRVLHPFKDFLYR